MIDSSKKETKLKNLDSTILDVEKRFGKGSVFLGHNYSSVPILCSTGSIALDIALGCHGIPEGRIIEIFGPESSGKTTMALIMMANVQKNGGIAAFIDAEHALDPIWAIKQGVNMNEVLFSQPDNGESALEIVEAYVRSNSVDYIIVDSVAALVPKAELEGDMGDSHMGLQARLMSQAMRKLIGAIAKSKCTVVFINQMRKKIGVMFGSPDTTTGGEALKYYATIRMDVRKEDAKIGTEDTEGLQSISMKVKIVKNKVASPFKIAHLPLLTGKNNLYGFDNYSEVFDLGIDNGLIKKAGAWFTIGTERFQGQENAINYLRSNPSIFEEIKQKAIEIVIKENKVEIGAFNSEMQKQEEELQSKKHRRSKKEKDENVESEEIHLGNTDDTNIVEGENIE